jgi:hypothetical protein
MCPSRGVRCLQPVFACQARGPSVLFPCTDVLSFDELFVSALECDLASPSPTRGYSSLIGAMAPVFDSHDPAVAGDVSRGGELLAFLFDGDAKRS